ncbi:hypothetical protein K443DRAFT_188895 [Laccaria amethystina LaAM-08-1]|jgi:hypothetical protein|uniref:Uncharacterized protein n=1 Tax=Laccaria amethystina LaAM-08-1 TaxID=1095629 RepID=A0A0C9XT34_9AGAR|nr:hypothetical protein K443DRAFT_188895 [Laccaria amethystina LaAM-08-1]
MYVEITHLGPANTGVVSLFLWVRHFLRHISWKTSNLALLDDQPTRCLVIFNKRRVLIWPLRLNPVEDIAICII